MKKENLKNLLLSVIALFVLVLLIFNTVALNGIREEVKRLGRDIGVSTSAWGTSPWGSTGSLKSDIDDLEWELQNIQKQLDDIDWRLRFK